VPVTDIESKDNGIMRTQFLAICLVTINIRCKSWMGTWIQMSWWSVEVNAILSLFLRLFFKRVAFCSTICAGDFWLSSTFPCHLYQGDLLWINDVLWEQSLLTWSGKVINYISFCVFFCHMATYWLKSVLPFCGKK